MAEQVPAAVGDADVIVALDGQAPPAADQVQPNDALNQVQAVAPAPAQPAEPVAEMVGNFPSCSFHICSFAVLVVASNS